MPRRWRLAIAIVASLSAFVALVAGSSLRPQFSAADLPEPAGWNHVIHYARAHPGQRENAAVGQSHSEPEHGLATGAAPAKSKTFLSMWMPRAVPTKWTTVSPHWDRLALPASFVAPGPGGATPAHFPAGPVNRDTSTLLCIIRC